MRYFFFSFIGDGLPLAYRLQQEGHDVTVGIVQDAADVQMFNVGKIEAEDKETKFRRLSLFEGMLNKVPAWKLVDEIKGLKSYRDCFVFFDRNNLVKFADALSHLPIHGNFPTAEDYSYEFDRNKAKEFVKKNYSSLKVAEVREFSQIQDAVTFLQNTDKHWVLKGKDDAAKTVVPDILDEELAAKQIIHALYSDQKTYEQSGFILELRIPNIIELTPGKLYFDGVPLGMVLDIENKPFGSGNMSFQTGCAQEIIVPISLKSKIHDIAFPKIADELAKQHKGLFYWDASLLFDSSTGDVYFGEFCPNRPGYDMIFCESILSGSVHNYFKAVSQKKDPYTACRISSSMRLFNPVTDDEGRAVRDIPIDLKKESLNNIWLWDIYKKDNQLVTAGDDLNVAVITGGGKSISESVDDMYNAVESVSFPGAYYRPKFDFLSKEYPTSIINRWEYGLNRELYSLVK